LFRFSSQNTNRFNDTSGVYFSVDSGKTNLANFDFTPNPIPPGDLGHDPGDFTNIAPDDPFNENTGLSNNLSDFDINLMGILGFKHAPVPGFPVQPPPPSLTHRVLVDITGIQQGHSPDFGSDGDYYSRIYVNKDTSTQQEQDPGIDNPITNGDFFNPGWSADFTVGSDVTSITLTIQLWDSDGFLNGDDDLVDVNPDPNLKDLTLTVNLINGTWTIPGLTAGDNQPGPETASGTDDSGSAAINFNVSVLGVLKEALVVNGNDLTIEGDQFTDHNDNIVIDKTTAGGLKVTINGNTVEYGLGQITSLTINTGGGTNTVSLLTPFSFTLNGGGTDKLILGPSLPPATFTPDPSGVPDFGVLNVGDTHVQLNSVEAVQNLAPAISGLQLSGSTINENGFVSLIGQFIDAGSLSTETVTVDWGDGTTDTVLQNAAGQRVFADTHQYLDDNPTGTPSDNYNIKVTVKDNDNLSASSTTSVTVNNVPPVIISVSSGATASNLAKEGQPVSFQGAFTDVGTQDTHTVTIDYADGTGLHSAQVTEAGGNGTFSDSHVFASGGIYPVSMAVTDDDTGQATTSTEAFVSGFGIHTFNGVTVLQGVGTNQSDTMVVKQHKDTLDVSASFLDGRRSFSTVGLDRIELYGLDGNDTLDVRNTTVPVILDGGNGDDTLRAGDGKDTLIGGAGDDRPSELRRGRPDTPQQARQHASRTTRRPRD
jgi:PKD domain/RTX calcium-binding nonapeptide repeat (4 copies)